MNLFEIDFLTVRLLDVIDILLVAFLIYVLYKIIRGSIALNVFIGFLAVYVVWLVVRAVNMRLLATILNQFMSVGVVALLIVFQQEIRRFLLMVGKNRVVFYKSMSWRQVLPWNWRTAQPAEINFDELARACKRLSQTHTGATIVLARSSELKFFASTGIGIEGEMSSKLFETIFMNKSPMHDGAVIVVKNRIKAASCILPVSENPNLPFEFGLRHRSALGITEQTDAMAIVVSEETGRITITSKGEYSEDLSRIESLSRRIYEEYFELPTKTKA